MRITESKSVKEFHVAYLENTKQINNEIQFLETIQVIDYLLKQYQVLKHFDNLIHESTLDFQERYREIAEYKLYNNCIEISLSIQSNPISGQSIEDQKLANKIIELQNEITKLNNFDGLELHEKFALPLLKFCSRELTVQNHRSLLINLCRQTISLYNPLCG